MGFELESEFSPQGDQPEAIEALVRGLAEEERYQVLLGVTGSGKTFTVANVIQQVQKPTLILSHNKTLAAQLYSEFKQFFPKNQVEFFISYYDYYQPEAFIASTGTYIEKDLEVNADIEKLRLRATGALLSGRSDVIIVASVSCIYGIGKPEEYAQHIYQIRKGQVISRSRFLLDLVGQLYNRTEVEFKQGNFRVRGDTVEVFPAYDDFVVRFIFLGDEIEGIAKVDAISGRKLIDLEDYTIFPAHLFVTSKETLHKGIYLIQDEMVAQVEYFKHGKQFLEAKRIQERTENDLEMMRELGYCKGVENYSRHLTGRKAGERGYCLLDYFPEDFLVIIDESHATIPQIKAMWGGDRSRKMVLVENGFRLPSALDNRPLTFEEFETLLGQVIFVSATPSEYELEKTGGVIIEQIVRPTGLLDPPVEVRPLFNQVDDLLGEVDKVVKAGGRVLVTTLTKRLSEELAKYLGDLGIKARYMHSGIDVMERVEILRDLRVGKFDVLVGINLLREGLDLPEVWLVAILDADKEGFLRSERSFIQTAGRAARSAEGRVILYAEKITQSMQKLIDETERRRTKQIKFNLEHNITPTTIKKSINDNASAFPARVMDYDKKDLEVDFAADPVISYMNKKQLAEAIVEVRRKMEIAAKELDFINAAKYRDEMFALEKLLEKK